MSKAIALIHSFIYSYNASNISLRRNDDKIRPTTAHYTIYLPGMAMVKYKESERCAHLIGAVFEVMMVIDDC